MKISPQSLKKQEFNKSMRGYDKEEVHAFLNKLADEIEELQNELESIRSEFDTATIELNRLKQLENHLNDTIENAQEAASKNIETSRRQAALMVKEAEIKAAQILDNARQTSDEMRTAVINLREEKDMIVAKLKAMINTQAKLLEMKVDEPEKESADSSASTQANKVDIDIENIVNKLL
ncbi:MAG: DivIVA domain-containing protein [Ignavibacteriales bacterium]|nr:MAG: DivIVA domain-containing protein [Ignavibacteriales bacterium]